MQNRLTLVIALAGLSLMAVGCGKKSGGGGNDDKPKKPQITTPSIDPGLTTPTPPVEEVKPPVVKPVVTNPNMPTKPIGVVTPPGPVEPNKPVVDPTKPQVALKGLWALSIAQKPRACSTFYDLRDAAAMTIHLLCPGNNGRTINLQTETFSRLSDNGKLISFKRGTSTCGTLANVPTSLNLSYTVTADQKLVLQDGVRTSATFAPLEDSKLAGDLKVVTALHGRPVVRGCFKAGNLLNFEAMKVTP